jgi:recombinational DNA repair protein RecR
MPEFKECSICGGMCRENPCYECVKKERDKLMELLLETRSVLLDVKHDVISDHSYEMCDYMVKAISKAVK